MSDDLIHETSGSMTQDPDWLPPNVTAEEYAGPWTENQRKAWTPGPNGDGRGRYDAQNRLLCKAKRNNGGGWCTQASMQGQEVCRSHGGAIGHNKRKAQLRLAQLVDPAIATLGREMMQGPRSTDRQRAANSILDRSGFGRATKVETEDARSILLARLQEIRAKRDAEGTEIEASQTDALYIGEDS